MKKLVILLALILLVASNIFAAGEIPVGNRILTGKCTGDAGTWMRPKPLSVDETAVQGVWIRSLKTNRNDVYIGRPGRALSVEGFVMSSDTLVYVPVDNLGDIYFQSTVSGEGVSWMAITP